MQGKNYEGLPISKYVTIGSFAFYSATHSLQLVLNSCSDIDVVCYSKDVEKSVIFQKKDEYSGRFLHKGKPIECLFADKQESLQYILSNYTVATLELLLEIKLGHITFPQKNWYKHIEYINSINRTLLENGNDFKLNQDFIKLHRKCTKERRNLRGTPKLKDVTKEQFFDDKVKKHFVHDDIHQWMAHGEKPMFTKMQKDSNLVECSKELWDKFSSREKIMCVLEEAYVIALERHMIPQIVENLPGLSPNAAFEWALKRICTTLCSGFFREYAIMNHQNIASNYDYDYVDKFLKKAEFTFG